MSSTPSNSNYAAAGGGDRPAPAAGKARPRQRRRLRPPRRILVALLLVPIPLMFGFAFLNIRLFHSFTEHFGINTNPNNAPVAGVHSTRRLTVLFTGVVTAGLPLQFTPDQTVQTVTVGRQAENSFTVFNPSDKTITFRAVHALYPEQAAHKVAITSDFTLKDLTLKPHQRLNLPIHYQVNPGMSKVNRTITWSYTVFARNYSEEEVAPWTRPKFTTQ